MFSEIIGHEEVLPRLKGLVLKRGVYLFHGSPSIGKRTVASTISKYILCKKDKDDGCDCSSCRIFPDHPDFLLLGTGGKVLTGDVDAAINFNVRAPILSETKTTIIDHCEIMTQEAGNRLLKLLEETSFTFFLITSDPGRLMPTIMSRCFRYGFAPLSEDNITNILVKRYGFSFPDARTLGWIGMGASVDIFSNADTYLKNRNMALDFLSGIKDLLGSLDFTDKVEQLPIFVDMLIMVMTDILLLQNNIEEIINSDKRDILKKYAQQFNDKAMVTSLGFITQVKKNAHLNINLELAFKSTLMKIHPILSL